MAQREATTSGPRPGVVATSRFCVRDAESGRVHGFDDLAMLRDWILRGFVGRDDEISRDGLSWRPLEEVPELAALFARAAGVNERDRREAERQARRAEALARAVGGATPSANDAHAASSARATGEARPSRETRPASPPPARAERPRRVTPTAVAAPAPSGKQPALRPPAPPWRLPLLVAIVAVALGGAAIAWLERDAVKTGQAALERGRRHFLLDTNDGFRKAVGELERAYAATPDVAALAELGEVHAVWALHLKDDAAA
jgi:hypothetical protein